LDFHPYSKVILAFCNIQKFSPPKKCKFFFSACP
jgi:hypothetical protein